jgi:hypothetical protein
LGFENPDLEIVTGDSTVLTVDLEAEADGSKAVTSGLSGIQAGLAAYPIGGGGIKKQLGKKHEEYVSIFKQNCQGDFFCLSRRNRNVLPH